MGILIAKINVTLVKAGPSIIYVPTDYAKIQWAIGNATVGDTIFVYNGTYCENLLIDKMILLMGENKSNTIIDGMGTGTVVSVMESNVNITGFTIRNSGNESEDSGICLYSSDNSRIDSNIIINSSRGIWLINSHRNDFTDNIVRNNTCAIHLRLSSYNAFKHNIIRNNTCGICLRDSSYNEIYHNSIINNTKQADVDESTNTWDDGYPSGGNYWSDYTGVDFYHGPYQNETGSDGIGDTPYNITATERDYYPRLLTVHNVDTELDYCWIQEAIDADETGDGHTIKVYALMYYEHVRVYKSLTLEVENRTTAIIDGGDDGTVLHVSASNVSISNFTIQNGEYGIHLDGSGNVTLRKNNMTNNKYNFFVSGTRLSHFLNDVDVSNWVDGKRIYCLINNQSLVIDDSAYPDLGYLGLVNCTNITVQNLNLTNNGQGLLLAFTDSSNITYVNASNNYYGIYLFGSSENTITANKVTNNNDGIYLRDSSANSLTGNNITNNDDFGVYLLNSDNSNIANNRIKSDGCGSEIFGSSGNNLTGNNVTGIMAGASYGIALMSSSNSSVADNIIMDYSLGIWLDYSSNNSLIGNEVTNNEGTGIYLSDSNNTNIIGTNITNNSLGILLRSSSENNIYHNNFINNTKQADVDESTNTWDDGYPSGGNYWSHYTYPDEKRGERYPIYPPRPQPDSGSDGIVDYVYNINPPTNIDWYALTKPYGGLHDIGIVNVTLSKTVFNYTETEPYIGTYNLTVTIKVINYGIYAETFNISATIVGTSISNQTTITLPYRNSIIKTLTLNTTGIKKGDYAVTVNATPVPDETYKADNTDTKGFTVTIQGDVNGDRFVNVLDLVLVKKAIPSYPGHPNWNPNADINNDGFVNVKDYVLTRKNIG